MEGKEGRKCTGKGLHRTDEWHGDSGVTGDKKCDQRSVEWGGGRRDDTLLKYFPLKRCHSDVWMMSQWTTMGYHNRQKN